MGSKETVGENSKRAETLEKWGRRFSFSKRPLNYSSLIFVPKPSLTRFGSLPESPSSIYSL
jgi:hypothetical protein